MRKLQILQDIKIIKENNKNLKTFIKEKYIDEDNIANIHIYANKDSIFNSFSDPSSPDISEEIFNYIEKESYYIPIEYKLRIVIHSEEDLQEDLIEKKIKEHYWNIVQDKEEELKTNRITSIILFLIGLFFLSLYFVFINIPKTKELFNEIFSIIGSFAVWESVDYSLISRSAKKIEYLNYAQLALLNVKISDKEKNLWNIFINIAFI